MHCRYEPVHMPEEYYNIISIYRYNALGSFVIVSIGLKSIFQTIEITRRWNDSKKIINAVCAYVWVLMWTCLWALISTFSSFFRSVVRLRAKNEHLERTKQDIYSSLLSEVFKSHLFQFLVIIIQEPQFCFEIARFRNNVERYIRTIHA